MITRLGKWFGLSTADEVVEFLIVGLAVLPLLLFIAGEVNAAAVIVVVLVNGLLIFGIRAREMETLEENREIDRREIVRAVKEHDERHEG